MRVPPRSKCSCRLFPQPSIWAELAKTRLTIPPQECEDGTTGPLAQPGEEATPLVTYVGSNPSRAAWCHRDPSWQLQVQTFL